MKTAYAYPVGKVLTISFVTGIALFSFFLAPAQAHASTGDITVNVKQELGSNLVAAQVAYSCNGSSYATIGGTTDADGNIFVGAASIATNAVTTSCTAGDPAINFRVSRNGYVTKTTASGNYDSTSDNSYNFTGVQFGVKVGVQEQLGNPLLGASVQVGTTYTTTCVEGGTADSYRYYYCAAPAGAGVGTSLSIFKDGFIWSPVSSGAYTKRSSNTDAQRVVYPGSLEYGHVVIADDDSLTVIADTDLEGSEVSCVAGGWGETDYLENIGWYRWGYLYYCAIPSGSGNSSITVQKSGFSVQNFSVERRPDPTTGQYGLDITDYTGSDYYYDPYNQDGARINVEDEIGYRSHNGATVSYDGHSCYNDDWHSDGDFYCPSINGTGTITISQNGYVSTTVTGVTTADGQSQTDAGTVNLQYAYKITDITTEGPGDSIASSLDGLAAGDNSGDVYCDQSDSTWYCPVPLNDSDGTLVAMVDKDGYVEQNYDLTTGTTRGSNSDAQVVDTVQGVQYAYKLSDFTSEANDATVVPDSVSVGGTSCTVDSGSWYCPVGTGATWDGTSASVSASGFVNKTIDVSARAYAQAPQVTDSVAGILYQIKIEVADELGHNTTADTITVAGATPDYSTDGVYPLIDAQPQTPVQNTYYFAQSGSNIVAEINKAGFINNMFTNGAIHHITTDPSQQLDIVLGANDQLGGSIDGSGDMPVYIKGLVYRLKSSVLQSQIGGDITDIADSGVMVSGQSGNTQCAASDDVYLETGETGSFVYACAVDNNTIYAAVTGDGGGDDVFSVRLASVTADGGTENGANFVYSLFNDSGDVIHNALASQKGFCVGPSCNDNLKDTTGFKYPLVVATKDELGNTINASDLSETVFDDEQPYYTSGNKIYFGNIAEDATLSIKKNGFVPSQITNSAFSGNVSDGRYEQTYITMASAGDLYSDPISGGNTMVRGLKYKLKSEALKTELGGDISDLADGYDDGGSPSSDATVTAGDGVTISRTAVDSGTLYIAAYGGDAGSVSVQVQNATADGGATNGASFVKSTLIDSGNAVFADSEANQAAFDIGNGSAGVLNDAAGFKYPLKVTVQDELNHPLRIADLDTTFDGVAPYVIGTGDASSTAYFANLAEGAALHVGKSGYVNLETTNPAINNTTDDQISQISIGMDGGHGGLGDSYSIYNGYASNYALHGLEFGQRIAFDDTFGTHVTPTSVTIGTDPTTTCAINDIYAYCPVPADGETYPITVSAAGYADNTSHETSARSSSNESQARYTISDVTYPLHVTDMRDELGNDIMPTSGTPFTLSDGALIDQFFDAITHSWYISATPGEGLTLTATVSGYVPRQVEVNTDQGAQTVGFGGGDDSYSEGAFLYPLKVNVSDELGNSVDASTLIENSTYDGVAAIVADGNSLYFSHIGESAAVIVRKDGFVPSNVTNTGLTDVTIAGDSQTVVTLTGQTTSTSHVNPGDNWEGGGLQYKFKSVDLQTEIGGNVTGIDDGTSDIAAGAIPGTGTVVDAYTAKDGVVYVAAHGDGPANGSDGMYIQLQHVTADGGEADETSLVRAPLTDTDSDMFSRADVGQIIFGVGGDGGAIATLVNWNGFQYPLKLVLNDELGNSMDTGAFDSITYGGTAPYATSTNIAYFGNTGNSVALNASKSGYVDALTTSAGLSDVDANQESQTVITLLGNAGTRDDFVDSGEDITLKGIQFSHKVALYNELGGALNSPDDVAVGDMHCTMSGDNIAYCPVIAGDDGANQIITVKKDGYVTNENGRTAYRVNDAAAQAVDTIGADGVDTSADGDESGVLFSHRFLLTREGDAGALSGATVTVHGEGSYTCQDAGAGFYYCAVPTSDDTGTVSFSNEGYVNTALVLTSDRVTGDDAQVAVTRNNMQFQLAALLQDQFNQPLDGSTFSTLTYDGEAPTLMVGPWVYWAHSATQAALVIHKDGYVAAETRNPGFISGETTGVTTNASAQNLMVFFVSNERGGIVNPGAWSYAGPMYIGTKIVVVDGDNDDASVSGATVKVGPSFDITCSESGSSGTYYCLVPTPDEVGQVKVTKSGYTTKIGSYAGRSADTDAQVVHTVRLATAVDGSDTAPTVQSQNPVANDDGISINVHPTVTFDKVMNLSTLTSDNIKLCAVGDGCAPVAASVFISGGGTQATIIPDTALDYSTDYYILVTTGVEDSFGNALASTYYDDPFLTESAPTPTAPTVTGQSPAQTTIEITGHAYVDFSTAMDPTTINSSTVQLCATGDTACESPISATVALSEGGTRATLTPASSLSYNTTYWIKVTTGAHDLAGTALASDYGADFGQDGTSWFNTYDANVPTVSSQYPEAASTTVALAVHPYLTFSSALNPDTVFSSTVKLCLTTDTSCASPIAATLAVSNSNMRVTIFPDSALSYATGYWIKVDGVQSSLGVAAASYGDFEDTAFSTIAPDAPTIASQWPTTGTDGTALTIHPYINFSKIMDATTINEETVMLCLSSDQSCEVPVTATVALSNGGTRAIVIPDSPLANSTWYWLKVSTGVHDASGNALADSYGVYDDNAFRTIAVASAPTVSAQLPTTGTSDVAITVHPTITFDQAIDPTTVTSSTVCVVALGAPSTCIAGTPVLDDAGTTVTITPAASLDYGTDYKLRVTTSVKNLSGTALASTYLSDAPFTTVSAPEGSLAVTAVSTVANHNGSTGYATANGTYADGFAWQFSITAPLSEQQLQMKFSDFVSGSNTIPAAGNLRYCTVQGDYDCSDESESSSDWRYVSDNDYDGILTLADDLDPSTSGTQVVVKVELKVPNGTSGGSYSASYGVQTTAVAPGAIVQLPISLPTDDATSTHATSTPPTDATSTPPTDSSVPTDPSIGDPSPTDIPPADVPPVPPTDTPDGSVNPQ